MSDELDQELARLRDDLRAGAARIAGSRAALAATKDEAVIGLAPRPPAPRNGRVIAVIAAAGLVAASVVAIAWPRGDGDADLVPATEPTAVTTVAPASTASQMPTTAVPTTMAPISLSLDSIAKVQFLDSMHGWLVGHPTGSSSLNLYATSNGVDWVPVHTPDTPEAVQFSDPMNGWLIGATHAWSTHDGGVTFTQVDAPLTAFDGDPSPILVHDGFVYAVGFTDGSGTQAGIRFHVYRSPVDHDDFQDVGLALSPGAGPVARFSLAATGDSVFVVYNDRVVSGAGRITSGLADPTWTPPAADGGGAIQLTSSGTGPLYAFGQTGTWTGSEVANKAFVSDDGGDTFRPITLPPNEPTDGTTLTAVDATTVMAVTAKGLYASTDEGTKWTLRSNPPADTQVTFHTPLLATAVANMGDLATMWSSTDGGWSWTRTLG